MQEVRHGATDLPQNSALFRSPWAWSGVRDHQRCDGFPACIRYLPSELISVAFRE